MIFNLFKAKPTLKELIPEGFVDIHSHILPGIDDGAKNIEESVELIEGLKKLGFCKIIGTPHTYPGMYNNSVDSIKSSYEKIKKNYQSKAVDIKYASEYYIDSSLIQKAENKELLCLKNNYILLECGFTGITNDFFDIIFKIIISGYKPVLAHPERYLYFTDDFKKIYKLKKMGVLFQINLLSINGIYGEKVVDFSNKLLKNNLIDFVGSDLHNKNQLISLSEHKIKIKSNYLENLSSIMDKTKNIF